MNDSRTIKATRSMVANGIYYVVNILLGIVNRKFLIFFLGIDYQGINGLFTSVLSILELAELGIGTAIIYHLYKPLAEDDTEQVKSIMHFYKKCYTFIAVTIAFIGGVLCVNIEFFVGTTELAINLKAVFLLMLADVIGTYTFSYKRSILYADQRNYLVANVNTGFTVCYNIAQILLLFAVKNYYLYLAVKLILRILSNVIINIVVNNRYPYLKGERPKKLEKEILADIIQKVKGLMCHKIGTFVVNGTDNIFISKFIDLAAVGVYANYNYVITAVNSLLNQIIDGAAGSVGNLLVVSDREHRLSVFKELNLLNLFVSTSALSIFSVAVDDFISLIFGSQYRIDRFVLAVLLVNMICTNQRRVWGMMKTAAGIQYEDRWIPLYESVVNLLMSYLLFIKFGLAGIFMGTAYIHLGVFFYTFPILVSKRLFETKYVDYLIYMGKMLCFQMIVIFVSFLLINKIDFNSDWISMIVKSFIAGIWSVVMFLIVFRKKMEFKALEMRLKRVANAKQKK